VNELKERLRADLTDAMRSRDQVRLRTLRMALTSITNEEVSGSAVHELSDEDIVKVLAREAKKRREAAEAFAAAGRADQAEAERAEGDVLATYLPAQLSDDGGDGDARHGEGHEGRHASGGGPGRGRPGRGRGPSPAERVKPSA
jgi:uncharacterized protein YqeY